MEFLIILIALIVLVLCLTSDNSQKGVIGTLLAVLFFPIGIIMALAKKYK